MPKPSDGAGSESGGTPRGAMMPPRRGSHPSPSPPAGLRSLGHASQAPAGYAASCVSSTRGGFDDEFAECPKEVPKKFAYWIQMNDLTKILADGNLGRAKKEGYALMRRTQGCKDHEENYSKLKSHMELVGCALKVRPSMLTNTGPAEITTSLKKLKAANAVFPFCLQTKLWRRVVDKKMGEYVTLDSDEKIGDLFKLCKPYGSVQDVDEAMVTFDPLTPTIPTMGCSVTEATSVFVDFFISGIFCKYILNGKD
eukprot:3991667-Pyramimonas_sp.AAC.1